MKESQIKKSFLITTLLFMASAASVLLVPFAIGKDGNLNTVGYIAGGLFWVGLISGIVAYRVLIKKANIGVKMQEKKAGRIRFFGNPPAKVTDGIMIVALIGSIYCAVNIAVNQVIAVIFLLLFIIGLYAHFLLNGSVYQHIWDHAAKRTAKNKSKAEEQEDEK